VEIGEYLRLAQLVVLVGELVGKVPVLLGDSELVRDGTRVIEIVVAHADAPPSVSAPVSSGVYLCPPSAVPIVNWSGRFGHLTR